MIKIKATVIFEISDEELTEVFEDMIKPDLPEKLKDEIVKVKSGEYENLLTGTITDIKVLKFFIPDENLPSEEIQKIMLNRIKLGRMRIN